MMAFFFKCTYIFILACIVHTTTAAAVGLVVQELTAVLHYGVGRHDKDSCESPGYDKRLGDGCNSFLDSSECEVARKSAVGHL